MIREFNPEIYPRRLWIGYACTDDEIKGYFGDNVPNLSEDTDASTMACCSPKMDKGGVFINFLSREAMTSSIIAHESVHAALEIFDYVKALITTDNQEPFAYLVGWIAKCCDKVRKEEKRSDSSRFNKQTSGS